MVTDIVCSSISTKRLMIKLTMGLIYFAETTPQKILTSSKVDNTIEVDFKLIALDFISSNITPRYASAFVFGI